MRFVILSISFFTVVFAIVSLIFYFGDWDRLAAVTLMGLFIGLVAAPEFEPKAFKKAWIWQLVSASVFGGLFGYVFSGDSEVIIACIIIFGFLGVTASYWVKHVQVP
jgi:hypothetical protein